MRNLIAVILMVAVVGYGTGCATLVNGAKQDVRIESNPPGAKVFVDEEEVGVTPLTVPMEREDYHSIRLSKEGYEDADETIGRTWSGWFLGNLFPCLACSLVVFGAVDYLYGSAYKLEPDHINVEMDPIRKN